MTKVDASKWCLLLSVPLGRMDTRVWLLMKKSGEGASVLTVGTTLLSALFPTVILTRRASAHSHAHTHTHTETTCTHSTPYAILYSCQSFPLNKSTFTHCSFVNDLFCCSLWGLKINKESVVCSQTGMKEGEGRQENMAAGDVLNKTSQL